MTTGIKHSVEGSPLDWYGRPVAGKPIEGLNVPLSQINKGGIGQPQGFVDTFASNDEAKLKYEEQYLAGQPKSLSGIAIRSFIIGQVLSVALVATAYLLYVDSLLWRLPCFLSFLCIFHFLEFWTTARYNNPSAQVSSFLLSQNGSAYNIAHSMAFLECFVTNYFFSGRKWLPAIVAHMLLVSGLCMIIVGQVVRSVAMVQAGTNFNHVVQHRKRNEHKLVTTGLYHYFRHPSYFGFFWWALGTQLVGGNLVCFIAYAGFLWRFFHRRIDGEEQLLVVFFGNDYVKFRETTGTWIPFIR